jgi:hypothetical protein
MTSKYQRFRARLTDILQSNRITRQFFPPKGNTAVILTLILGVVSIFLVFRLGLPAKFVSCCLVSPERQITLFNIVMLQKAVTLEKM